MAIERDVDIYEKTDVDELLAGKVSTADIGDPETPAGAALSATFDTLTQAARRASLAQRAAADASLSSAKRAVEWEDTSVFSEEWDDLSAWSSGTFGQVSGGRLYSDSQGGNSGANHSFVVAAGESARAIFDVRVVSGIASGGVAVGVSSDTAGGSFGGGGSNMRGIYFSSSGIRDLTSGIPGTPLGSIPAGTTDWRVVFTIDTDYVTVTARTVDGALEYRFKWDRTGWNVNNVTVFNSDTRELTGCSVGVLAARKSMSTVSPAIGVEGHSPWCVWTDGDASSLRILVPADYDSRRPSPVAIVFHGNGSDETYWWSNANMKAVAEALVAGGYIVVGAAATSNTTWGNDDAIAAYDEAYEYVREHFNIGPVVFYANSMGGVESLNVLARDAIPGVMAWAGTVPTYDLAENYANALFTSVITSAYDSDYAANSVGHDPNLMGPALFRGIPMWMLVATDDTSVTPSANGLAMSNDLADYNAITKVEVTGGHSTSAIASNASTIVAFFDAAIGRA